MNEFQLLQRHQDQHIISLGINNNNNNYNKWQTCMKLFIQFGKLMTNETAVSDIRNPKLIKIKEQRMSDPC